MRMPSIAAEPSPTPSLALPTSPPAPSPPTPIPMWQSQTVKKVLAGKKKKGWGLQVWPTTHRSKAFVARMRRALSEPVTILPLSYLFSFSCLSLLYSVIAFVLLRLQTS
jgi:hypothetical protein